MRSYELGSTIILFPEKHRSIRSYRPRKCKQCSVPLSRYNPNKYCYVCLQRHDILPAYIEEEYIRLARDRRRYARQQRAKGKKIRPYKRVTELRREAEKRGEFPHRVRKWEK